ncbi:unnamed protein product [Cuscuta campestris]|uniref:Uncharacterized protein n=1 Tax=Cuscuta campestris TaxID=132261 RepID=A0A484MPJ8_9ASTE|nr:unnamed protein product [Cuscuta campestris]
MVYVSHDWVARFGLGEPLQGHLVWSGMSLLFWLEERLGCWGLCQGLWSSRRQMMCKKLLIYPLFLAFLIPYHIVQYFQFQ